MTDRTLEQIRDAFQAGQRATALEDLRGLVSRRAVPEGRWRDAGFLARYMGDFGTALKAAEKFAAENPSDPSRKGLKGEIYLEIGQVKKALAIADELAGAFPDVPQVRFGRALMLIRLGRFGEAEDALRKLLKEQPGLLEGWYELARLKSFTADDDSDLARMRDVLASVNADDPRIAPLHHGLALAYDALDERAQAVAHWRKAADLLKGSEETHMEARRAQVERIIKTFDSAFMNAETGKGYADTSPVLMPGMPECGNALLERALAAGSNLSAGGETVLPGLLALRLGDFSDTAMDQFLAGGKAPWAGLGEIYAAMAGEIGLGDRFIDRSPTLYMLAGPMALALSSADFIEVIRDRREQAFRLYTGYIKGAAWSHDVTALADYLNLYDRLMGHWRDVVGDRWMRIAFEELVSSSGKTLKAAAKAVNVPYDKAMAGAHEADLPAELPSAIEAHQPLAAQPTDTWKRYETELAPLFNALDS